MTNTMTNVITRSAREQTQSQEQDDTSSQFDVDQLAARFRAVRSASRRLCDPLEIEDYGIQSMPDASPTKWHMAHTTWFFETFVLSREVAGYTPVHPEYAVLFNSYYNAVGEQYSRPERGLLSRPTVSKVIDYRDVVDDCVESYLKSVEHPESAPEALTMIETGIHHEQQHQELMLMDIKHAFAANPLRPAYRTLETINSQDVAPLRWVPFEESLEWTGHAGDGFAFDNESPRHRNYIESFQMADRLVNCGEYADFIADGGYERPELWLSDGWATIQKNGWTAPLYWERGESSWSHMTLAGMRDVNPSAPVSHVSFYEADAFARWMGCWLPHESSWEAMASRIENPADGNFVESDSLQPLPPPGPSQPTHPVQMFGDLWEWTCSAYSPYPGFRAATGALGEYNGKFMCNQMVLRGGAYGTPRHHIRATYRNFFPPEARWAFSGIRLTKEFV
jgi:ergothioneine biosynthesis protein EgtB